MLQTMLSAYSHRRQNQRVQYLDYAWCRLSAEATLPTGDVYMANNSGP